MIRILIAWLLLACVSAFAGTPDERIISPDEAFRFEASVKDAHTVTARWIIADGYYLHRENFQFLTDTPDVKLGDPGLPTPEVKHDGTFGDMQIYRGTVEVELPVEYAGAPPGLLKLRARAQGCADLGVCFPPMTRKAELSLAGADVSASTTPADGDVRISPATAAASPLSGLSSLLKRGQGNDDFPDAEQAYRVEAEAAAGGATLHFRVLDGTYLYRDRLGFVVKSPIDAKLGTPTLPQGKIKQDEYFGKQEIYEHDFDAFLPVEGAAGRAVTLTVKLQGCAKAGICYPPMTREVAFTLGEGAAASDATSTAAPAVPVAKPVVAKAAKAAKADLSEQDFLLHMLRDSSIWVACGLFFVLGLGLAFTPCVFPMVPILSGLIVGNGRHITPRQAFLLSLVFVLAMALTYAVLGVIAGASGANLQAWFQRPAVLYTFAGVFVLLALSMFGLYDLQLPASLQTRLSNASNHQKSGSLVGAGIMGFFSAIIVGPCVTPPLVAALLYISQQGHAWMGGTVLFVMGLGMGTPLLVLGASAGHLLPRAGAWMDAVKEVFGVLLLGVALWLLDRVLPQALLMALAGVLVIVSGIYMGALDHLAAEVTGWRRLWKGLGLAAMVYGALLLVGAASGGQGGLLQPLSGVATASRTADVRPSLAFQAIKGPDGLKSALDEAAKAGRPVMLDFYADWCVSCKELEAYTFTDAGVQAELKRAVLLRADVTANDDADRALERDLGIPGPPAVLFYDARGQELKARRLFGFKPAADFAAHVRAAFGE